MGDGDKRAIAQTALRTVKGLFGAAATGEARRGSELPRFMDGDPVSTFPPFVSRLVALAVKPLATGAPAACVTGMLIAWTTVPTKTIADELAASAVQAGLAVCVQVEGPIESHYVWEGVQEKTAEYRLMFKALASQGVALETWIHGHHPYVTPEWMVIKADHVAEKYLSWARARPNNLPL